MFLAFVFGESPTDWLETIITWNLFHDSAVREPPGILSSEDFGGGSVYPCLRLPGTIDLLLVTKRNDALETLQPLEVLWLGHLWTTQLWFPKANNLVVCNKGNKGCCKRCPCPDFCCGLGFYIFLYPSNIRPYQHWLIWTIVF